MTIFQDLVEYGRQLDERNKITASGQYRTSDKYSFLDLTEEQRKEWETNYKKPLLKPPKKSVLWHIVESLRCLGQILLMLVIAVLAIYTLSFMTKGCSSSVDTEHVHYEKFQL